MTAVLCLKGFVEEASERLRDWWMVKVVRWRIVDDLTDAGWGESEAERCDEAETMDHKASLRDYLMQVERSGLWQRRWSCIGNNRRGASAANGLCWDQVLVICTLSDHQNFIHNDKNLCSSTLSQWRECGIRKMWDDLGVLTTTNMREFWICWRELQSLSLEWMAEVAVVLAILKSS